jgi:hypothetical protein
MAAIGVDGLLPIRLEAWGQGGDLVAMAHPDVEQPVPFAVASVLDAPEQLGVAAGAHFGIAELAAVRAFDAATQLRCHQMHAVADAEHRHA